MATTTTSAEGTLPTAIYIRRHPELSEYVLATVDGRYAIGCTLEAIVNYAPDGLTDALIDCPDTDAVYPGRRCEFFILDDEGGVHLDTAFSVHCERLKVATNRLIAAVKS